MSIFNYKSREIILKIVYYGPGLGGKTTSLQYLYQQVIPERKGELFSLATEKDQTIYLELFPFYVGEIKNFKLRFQVYTVPGQVKYNNTRKAVLQGVDAIVFVADSQSTRRKANLRSFENLKYNLKGGYNFLLENIPLVYEYNKRDMEGILTVTELNQELNARNLLYFETVATEGEGILEAFESASSLAVKNLENRLFQLEMKPSPSSFREEQKKFFQSPESFSRSDFYKGDEETDVPFDKLRANGRVPYQESDKHKESLETSVSKQPFDSVDETEAFPLSEDVNGSEGFIFPEDVNGSEILPLPEEKDKHFSYLDIFAETYRDSEAIFEEGDPGDKMYFIADGRVRIVGSYKHTRKVLAIYGKGDFFGEMAIFGGHTRSATAVAIGTTHLLPVSREILASQIQKKPEIAMTLLETLADRIRNDTQTISRLADQNRELMRRLKQTHDTNH
jgi:signal recognition particle receptor subunit beta